ncbi:TlpA family protein disulfide reductase [Sphingobacterium faecium]|uniref:TlpA family protein disulfide reductase n=1 Tax=Sphingobacterium faecium TaxID=34087 RepID=UPI003DA42AB8
MNKTTRDIIKFWGYLRKLLKPNGEEFLLSRKQPILSEYSAIRNIVKNTIAQVTNCVFMQRLSCYEGALNVGDNDMPDLELDNHSSDYLLLNNQIESKELAVKQQRISKQGATQGLCRSLETLNKQQTNGNESAINKRRKGKQTAMKYQTKGNEPTMNKQTKTKENRSGSINSDFFLTKLTPTSKFLRLGFDSASGFHRLQCMKSRRIVEQNPSGCRKKGREKEKKVSRSFLDMANSKSKLFLGGTRSMPTFNKLRILFYLRTSLHRMGTVPLPSLHQEKDGAGVLQVLRSYRETYYRVKRRLKEGPNKIGADGFAFFMIFMKNVSAKTGLAVRSVYRLFTNSLLKWYRKGTEKLLESYQIGTNGSSLATDLKATAGEAPYFNGRSVDQASVMRCICIDKAWIVRKTVSVYTLLTHYQRFMYALSILDLYAKGALFQTSVFKHLKFLCWAKVWPCVNKLANRLKTPLNNMLSSVHDAVSEWGVYEFRKLMGISFNALNSIRTYSLLVLMFYMFSLSAQTPRKDNGADGLNKIKPLMVGDTIPEALWHLPLDVLNYAQGSQRIYLNNFRDKKLILLDFWTVWCVPCINKLKELSAQLNLLDEDAIVVPVTKNNASSAQHILKQNDVDLFSIYADSMLIRYFPHVSVPHQIWIKDGIVTYITDGNLTTVAKINDFVMNKPVQLLQKESEIDHSDLNKLTISDTSQMIADNTIFSSSFTKALPYNIFAVSEKKQSLTLFNHSIIGLLLYANRDNIPFSGMKNRIIWRISDSLRQRMELPLELINTKDYKTESNLRQWKKSNLYCYYLTHVNELGEKQKMDLYKQDLSRFLSLRFNVKAYVVDKSVESFCLYVKDKTVFEKFQMQNGTPKTSSDVNSYTLVNRPLRNLIAYLRTNNFRNSLPIADMTGYAGSVSLKLEADPKDLNAVDKALYQFGLGIKRGMSTLPMLIVERSGSDE